MFLTGEYHHQIDEKNRIRIPAKLKDLLGPTPVIMKGNSKCLYVYSQEQAEIVMAQRMAGRGIVGNKELDDFIRTVAPTMLYAEEDKQGRVTLTPKLIQSANLSKNIVTIGAYDRAEIWDEEEWEKFYNCSEEEYEERLNMFENK